VASGHGVFRSVSARCSSTTTTTATEMLAVSTVHVVAVPRHRSKSFAPLVTHRGVASCRSLGWSLPTPEAVGAPRVAGPAPPHRLRFSSHTAVRVACSSAPQARAVDSFGRYTLDLQHLAPQVWCHFSVSCPVAPACPRKSLRAFPPPRPALHFEVGPRASCNPALDAASPLTSCRDDSDSDSGSSEAAESQSERERERERRHRPCGLSPSQVAELLHREITPEDYELLGLLDQSLAKPTAPRRKVDALPLAKPRHFMGESCTVCLNQFARRDQVVALPCKHCYHRKCISRWLLAYRATCPICGKDVRHRR